MLNQRTKKVYLRSSRFTLAGLVMLLVFQTALVRAEQLNLESIDFNSMQGDRLELQFNLNGPAFSPKVFKTSNPARISLDFAGVNNALKQKVIPINVGATQSVRALEASGRTRVVVNLLELVSFDTRVDGNKVFLTLNGGGDAARTKAKTMVAGRMLPQGMDFPRQSITNIDFRRGNKGEGRVLVSLADKNTIVDMQERGGKIVLYFLNTKLPKSMARHLDVMDFATPVKSIDTVQEGGRIKMTVTPSTEHFDYSSFQTDGLLTIEVRSLTRAQKEILKKKKFSFTGERLSLNFQNIEVRSVLQLLADFTNRNLVVGDSVAGNITLRLDDVPSDQALDIILRTKKLGMRQNGKVMWVAPLKEINEAEKEELEALRVVANLAPLRTELMQINYAKAAEIADVLNGTQEASGNRGVSDAGSDVSGADAVYSGGAVSLQSILSERGSITVDERTNNLIVKDTARNLEAIRGLISKLDKPVRQVMIEARIVIASNSFTKELGVRLGGSADLTNEDPDKLVGIRGGSTDSTIQSGRFGDLDFNQLVDLGAAVGAGAGGGIGFTLFKAGEYLLDLELSALQSEGRGEIVSNPRLLTSDQTTAKIEQGVEIPFATVSQNGTVTQFKEAVLKLEVTPHITPDDQIVMELLVKKDAPGQSTPSGLAIDKREIETTVQVANGETIVLGGVYESTRTDDIDKVPFFGDLPGIGHLFRKKRNVDDKTELLIFITPKVVKSNLVAM